MTEQRVVDFLRAAIEAAPDFAGPKVSAVKLQVRTGSSVMPKRDMIDLGYVVLVWDYPVKDVKRFNQFMQANEDELTKIFDDVAFAFKDANNVDRKRLGYHGTFPVRSAGGATTTRCKTMWSGQRDWLYVIEKCRLAPSASLQSPAEKKLADMIQQMFTFVDGDVSVEILDPKVGL
jgi:hypothetical protein